MNVHSANYRKIWWLYGVILGGTAAMATFLAHAWIQTIGTSLDAGPFFSFELIPIFGVCVAVAALYLPVLFLSDMISKKSFVAALASAICFSLVLATLILLKKHFEIDPGLITRGWSIYLYALVMGAFCLYGWQRSKRSGL